MRIKSLRTGNEVHVENQIGQALIALGDAVEVPPTPPAPKPVQPVIRTSAWAASATSTKPQPGDRSMKIQSTPLPYERETALAERTKKYRPRVPTIHSNGGIHQDGCISVGDLCGMLGISPKQLEEMSDERLHFLCTHVPQVPVDVDGSQWGQRPYTYAEFMRRGETWIAFLHRIGVGAPTLARFERAQIAARLKPLSEIELLGRVATIEATRSIVHVDD